MLERTERHFLPLYHPFPVCRSTWRVPVSVSAKGLAIIINRFVAGANELLEDASARALSLDLARPGNLCCLSPGGYYCFRYTVADTWPIRGEFLKV